MFKWSTVHRYGRLLECRIKSYSTYCSFFTDFCVSLINSLFNPGSTAGPKCLRAHPIDYFRWGSLRATKWWRHINHPTTHGSNNKHKLNNTEKNYWNKTAVSLACLLCNLKNKQTHIIHIHHPVSCSKVTRSKLLLVTFAPSDPSSPSRSVSTSVGSASVERSQKLMKTKTSIAKMVRWAGPLWEGKARAP